MPKWAARPKDVPVRLESGDVVVDVGAHRATRGNKPLRLKPREFDLLAYFLRHPGQVLTRERLLRNVWGYEYAGDTRTVDVHVRWLRGKIEPDAATADPHPDRARRRLRVFG